MNQIRNVPFTVIGFAVLTWILISNGVEYGDVIIIQPSDGITTVLNPFIYIAGMFFHTDVLHYRFNMFLFVPFGILLTWLTSNRHVLGVMIVSHFLTRIARVGISLSLGIISIGVGSSLAVFGIMAASLVRVTGVAMKDATEEALQVSLFGVLAIFMSGLFMVTVLAGGTVVDHLGHALGFLFGGAVESMYVFKMHEKEKKEKTNEYEFLHKRR